jgi:hypothetical protein
MPSDELAQDALLPHVTPTEDGTDHSKPQRVALPKCNANPDGFILVEEAVLGYEAVAADANFQRRTGTEIADPVSVRPPSRHDDDLARVGVIREDHRHCLARLTGPSTYVNQHEECPAQYPALIVSVKQQRRSEHRQRQSSRHATKTEPASFPRNQ